jgi:hypothetical protein
MNNSNNVQGNNILPRAGANVSANYRNLTGTVLPRVGPAVTAEYRELVESSTGASNSMVNNFRMPPSNRANSRFTNFFAEREAGNTARRVAESALPRTLRRNAPEFVPAAGAAAGAAAGNGTRNNRQTARVPKKFQKTGLPYIARGPSRRGRRGTRRSTRRLANRR